MKNSLSKKIALMFFVNAFFLSVALIILSCIFYWKHTTKQYITKAMGVAKVVAEQINPDRVQHFLDITRRSPDFMVNSEYRNMYKKMMEIQYVSDVESICLIKPETDSLYCVLDTTSRDGGQSFDYNEYQEDFSSHKDSMLKGDALDPVFSSNKSGYLVSVYYAMRGSNGVPAGYVRIVMRGDDIKSDLHSLVYRMILMSIAISSIFIYIYIYFATKTISDPVKVLTHAAERIVDEEESGKGFDPTIFSKLDIRSNGEIGELHQSLKQMERHIQDYMTEFMRITKDKERYSAELNVATQIQADMLPNIFPPYPERSEFDVFAIMNPAKQVGGDFYDFFLVDHDHLAIVMADVSGKGVPAALYMVIAKTLIKNRAKKGGSPAEIFANVNKQLCDGNKARMFVTAWLGVIELSTGTVREANAGHEHPVICSKNGQYELRKYRHSPPLGLINGLEFQEHSFQMKPGDSLYVYTDGVTEAVNENGELFGSKRLIDTLNQNPSAEPKETVVMVRKEIASFSGDAEQCDDITMLDLHYFGPLMSKEVLRLAKKWLDKPAN